MKKIKLTKKQALITASCILLLCILAAFALCEDLKTVSYTVDSDKINGNIRIAVISDLHSSKFGSGQSDLIAAIDTSDPDVVLLTGDIFEEDRDHENVKALLSHIGKKYTCFFVTGNHEYRFSSDELYKLRSLVRSYGVAILDGDSTVLSVNGESIRIAGVNDPCGDNFVELDEYGNAIERPRFDESLTRLSNVASDGIFTVLMSHRPDYFEKYASLGFDLTVSGHAHGGQIVIPGLVNGLFAPDQGLFPEYAGGRYEIGESVMIVSRGLCRMAFRPRVFNRPELVIIDVK